MEDELYRPISSIDTPHLTATITSFLNYDLLQLTSKSTRNRFYTAIPKIFEVCFGLAEGEEGRYKDDGGLLAVNYVARSSYNSSNPSTGYNGGSFDSPSSRNSNSKSPPPSHSTSLFTLLTPETTQNATTLLQLIVKPHEVKFTLPISYLPIRTQLLLSQNNNYVCVKTGNENLYFKLLSTTLSNQKGLLPPRNGRNSSNNSTNSGSVLQPSSSSPSSHSNSNSISHYGKNDKANPPTPSTPAVPHLTLSMSEYFFFTFVRFASAQELSGGRQSLRSIGGIFWNSVGGNLYGGGYGGALMRSNLTKFNGTTISTYNRLLRSYLKLYFPPTKNHNPTSIQSEAEFFLRLIVEFWLEENAVITKSYPRGNLTTTNAASAKTYQPNAQFMPLLGSYKTTPPTQAESLTHFITHLCGDPNQFELSKTFPERISQIPSHQQHAPQTIEMYFPLTIPLRIVQQPLFGYLQLAFTHASLHSQYGDSPFAVAVNLWLLYLEPWKVTKAFEATVTSSTPSSSSSNSFSSTPSNTSNTFKSFSNNLKSVATGRVSPLSLSQNAKNKLPQYTQDWAPYVISNFHMYVTLLSTFVKRARELDYSLSAYNKNLSLIKRVLDVFSPALLQTLASSKTSPLYDTHCSILGSFQPPFDSTIESIAPSLRNLFDEIVSQKIQTVNTHSSPDLLHMLTMGMISSVDGSNAGNIIDGTLKKVISQGAEMYPNFSNEFSGQALLKNVKHFGNRSKNNPQYHNSSVPEKDREMPGFLSPVGKQQISRGLRKCNPLEISSFKDPMLAPVASYELSFLVSLTIFLSQQLNSKFELDIDANNNSGHNDDKDLRSRALIARKLEAHWRFNLRFLADVRNLFLITIIAWLIF